MNYAIDQMMRAAEDADGTIDTLCEELIAAEADRDAQRARADAAEAEVARQNESYQRVMVQASALALARDEAEAEVARLLSAAQDEAARAVVEYVAKSAALERERDAALADAARLRAIVDGRTTAPTVREARAHCHGARESRGAFIATRLDWGAHGGARVATGLQPLPGAPHRWIALDAEGRPCAWPVVP